MKFLKDTLVQIRKPTMPIEEWKIDWLDVHWDKAMDKYDGDVDRIKSTYSSTCSLKHIGYSWHHDWLVVGTKDENGKFIPLNNEGLSHCHWCKVSTKITKEHCDEGIKTFTYCPKCGR